jgi:hypothetical protein
MLRYVAAAVVFLVLLALALRSRPADGGGPALLPAAPPGPAPVVRVEPGRDGRVVTVKHTLRGSVTRAALVYEQEGEDRHAAVETDCRRGGDASVEDDGYATVVELKGVVPAGATRVRLVLESETGTSTYPIEP